MGGRGLLRRPLDKLALVGLAMLIPAVAGCELLFPGFAPPVGDPGFPGASPLAEFGSGTAKIAIEGGETLELGQLHGDAELNSFFGASISWENESGWYLRLLGAGDKAGGPAADFPATLTIDRIVDGEHWSTRDPERCLVDIDKADKTGVKGSATCKGLQWHDALASYDISGPNEDLVPDQPKFDATITFEALPKPTANG
jgi:hypothetical protein